MDNVTFQGGQCHISPDMSNRKESMNKKSWKERKELGRKERTHSRKFRVYRKDVLDSKYAGFDLNVCNRTLKPKKTFCDIRRDVKGSARRFSLVVDASKVASKERAMEDLDNLQRRMTRNAGVGHETNLHLYWKDITMES